MTTSAAVRRPEARPQARYRPTVFADRATLVEHRPDGTILLRSAAPAPDPAGRGLGDYVSCWAERRPDARAFCERDDEGAWRSLLMAEPPSIDANEIADKGYVNPRPRSVRAAPGWSRHCSRRNPPRM